MKTVYDFRLENSRALIDQVGGGSSFAEKIGRTASMVSRYTGKNPVRQIGNELARHIEACFGLEPGWLDSPHESAGDSHWEKLLPAAGFTARVPLISRVQAGSWREIADQFSGDFIEVAGRVGKRSFALRVEGDSMVSPAGGGIPDGALVIVDPELPADNGRIVVARVNGSSETTIKKLVIDGGDPMLVPLNPRYPVIGPDRHWEVVGVVTKFQCDL
jgi:SOS-response transcriptional repressor LexA